MKTAEEILVNFLGKETQYYKLSAFDAIKAMKLYSNAKLEEAKLAVSLRETNVYTTPDTDTGFSQGIDAAMETILSLKDKV